MPKLDIVVKKIEAQLVASMRERISSIGRMGEMFAEVEEHIKRHGGKIAGPGTSISHCWEHQDEVSDIETVYPISTQIPESESIRVYELPEVAEMACLIYQGKHDEASKSARQTLITWIEENGYRVNGPDRLAFLDCAESEGQSWVVEFQYPVER